MHICVIGENQPACAAASNHLSRNGHTVTLGENEDVETKSLLSEIKGNLRSSDMIVVLSSNAKAFAISANKMDGVNAVACRDHEDALDAVSSADANVAVINYNADRRMLISILDGLTSGARPERRSEKTADAPKFRERAQAPAQRQGPSILSGIKDAASNAASGVKDAAGGIKSGITKPGNTMRNTNETIGSIRSKGLMKHIKETFGIED